MFPAGRTHPCCGDRCCRPDRLLAALQHRQGRRVWEGAGRTLDSASALVANANANPTVSQPIVLVLLDIPPMLPVLDGVVMELQDCALPLLRGEQTLGGGLPWIR